jgi:hypothetical protein
MNQVTVWYGSRDTYSGYDTFVRFTKGEMINITGERDPKSGVLHYEGDLNALLKDEYGIIVYHTGVGNLKGNFYFSKEAAIEAVKSEAPDWWQRYENYCVDDCYLDKQGLYPVSLPVTNTLSMGKKGLYCRLNLRPDLDGTRTEGMLFFPDRRCTSELCAGPAVITEVNIKGTYGFFKAHMKQFEAPSESELINRIVNNQLYNETVSFYSSKFGEFVKIGNVCYVTGSDNSITSVCCLDVYDSDAKVVESYIARDFVCRKLHGCSFEELTNSFGKFEFNINGSTPSIKFISHLVDEAVALKVISTLSACGVDYAVLSSAELVRRLDQFSTEELKELAIVCSSMNEKANEAIKSKIRKGKMSLASLR